QGKGQRSSGGSRSLQLDDIAFRVADVDRRAFALGTITRTRLFDRDAVTGEMGADRGIVEAVESEREMIQVAALGPRRRAAHRAELARDGDEIDQGVTGTKLIEADLRLLALVGAAEDLLVEAAHPVEID